MAGGCSPVVEPPPEPQPEPLPVPERTALPSPLPPPTSIPNPLPDTGAEPGQVLEALAAVPGEGLWSPVGDTLLLAEAAPGGQSSLLMAASPGFEPVPLAQAQALGDFAWSPGAQEVVYAARSEAGVEIWAVSAAGGQPRRLDSAADALSTTFLGWLDLDHLALAADLGAGHRRAAALQLSSSSLLPWGAVLFGELYPPHNGYIPALAGSDLFEVILVSGRFPEQTVLDHLNTQGSFVPMPQFEPPSPPLAADHRFVGWRGESSQALVLWTAFVPGQGQAYDHHLLLWDVEGGQVRLAAAGGRGGLASPDGRWLAYLGRGPARSGEALPQPGELPRLPGETLSRPESADAEDTLHLLDLSAGQTAFSWPEPLHRADPQARPDSTGTHQVLEASFSPGSRFLAFLSRGPARSALSGAQAYLNIYDLQDGRFLFSEPAEAGSPLAWSPGERWLAYRSDAGGWRLLDLPSAQFHTLQVPEEGSAPPAWSASGRYLSLPGQGCAAPGQTPCRSYLFDLEKEG